MPKVKYLKAREILDSRGNPTIETRVELSSGAVGLSQVPSGASTGRHEAWELRDGGKRYLGQGVLKAVANVNEKIARKLYGADCQDPDNIDRLLIEIDATPNKKSLGANAILSVSLACARARAAAENLPLYKYLARAYKFTNDYGLPRPMFNIINGGRHADNNLSIQEFMIVPRAKKFRENLRRGVEIYHALHAILKQKKFSTGLGDEGGFAPAFKTSEEALQFILLAAKQAGFLAGKDLELALDVAASEFKQKNNYRYEGRNYSARQLVALYQKLIAQYPIFSIEDGLGEDDWSGWQEFTKELSAQVMLVGDDLFVTNPQRLQIGLEKKVANAILIKLNQIGTLLETVEVIKTAQQNNYHIIISHRSGETGDDFIADLAVACQAEFIKSGAPARFERVAKYNRLLAIESELAELY